MNIIAYFKGFHVDIPVDAANQYNPLDIAEGLENVKGLINTLLASDFKSSWNPETAKQSETAPVAAPAAFAASLEATVEDHFCASCGTKMVMRSGTKDGKTWKGYFCPKDREHKPVWAK